MILLQKLQAHSQVYIDGELLNLKKAPGRQVVSILLSTKEGGNRNKMENGRTRKCDRKETGEPYTGRTDQRGKRRNE